MFKPLTTRLYAWGSNGSGQLGVGHQEDLTEPQICCFASSAHDDKSNSSSSYDSIPYTITKLVAGGNHTLILTDAGRVYASGHSADGRCGVLTQNSNLSKFTAVAWAQDKHITDIAATWEASYFIEDAQRVWVCGTGNKGELGLGIDTTLSAEPAVAFDVRQHQLEDTTIVAISGCMNHVVVVLSSGQVYGWGNSRKGNLGQSFQSRKVVWKPKVLELPESIKASAVVTGRDFTLSLNSNQEFILLGDVKSLTGLSELKIASSETQFLAGWSTVYIVDGGRVRGYGLGRRGQLPPESLSGISGLAVGSEHCVALLKDGQVVAWGWGEHGNCGLPVDNRSCVIDRYNTISIPVGETAIGVGAGCASSFLWTMES